MITKKYTYNLLSPDYKKFKQIQREAKKIYQETIDCEFSYLVDREDKLKIIELIKFKTFEDFTKADKLEDSRLDDLIIAFRAIVDFDSITEEELLNLNIEEE